ncbi:MAG: NAD(P)/FAD-dependent oxidoreductase [Bacilli bacterium]
MDFYKDHYDAVVIGGALSGMACALTLAKKGKSVLILERHNLPGGIATSFVRGGVEMEATLHEMMSIGPEDQPLKIRTFFNDFGIKINWLRVPEAYRISVPKENIDITLHAGLEKMAKEIDAKYPGTYSEVLRLMKLCDTVYNSVNVLSVHPMSKPMMLLKHNEFVKTCGYSAKEVMDTFNLPQEVKDILSAYWIYVGNPLSSLPFTIYAVLMADYFGGGSYVCSEFSHEMSVKMAEKCLEMGVQIEYLQTVEKILVKNGKVIGVRTKRGDVINTEYVSCSAYPNTCYSRMIEPKSEVPEAAYRSVNARKISVTCFSVVLLLDKSPEELNIHDYSVFSSETDMNLDKMWESMKTQGPYDYLTTICLNYANPDCTPKGMTSLSITTLPLPEGFLNVKADDYFSMKRRIAKGMIDTISKQLGVNLLDHVLEVEIESPMTISHYAGAYQGGIYGYQHNMDDHIVARLQMSEEENYIHGLAFSGAHAISGNGMSPVITNGRKAAKTLLEMMSEDGK